MPDFGIESITTWDARFPLPDGAGMDALHTNSEYCFAVTLLRSQGGLYGTGIAWFAKPLSCWEDLWPKWR
jgi:hypothetical protein